MSTRSFGWKLLDILSLLFISMYWDNRSSLPVYVFVGIEDLVSGRHACMASASALLAISLPIDV